MSEKKPWDRNEFDFEDAFKNIQTWNANEPNLSAAQFGDNNTQISVGDNSGSVIGTQNNNKIDKLIQGMTFPEVAMFAFSGIILEHILHNKHSESHSDIQVIHKYQPVIFHIHEDVRPSEVAYGSWHQENAEHVLYLYKFENTKEWNLLDLHDANQASKYIPVVLSLEPDGHHRYTLIGKTGISTVEENIFRLGEDYRHLSPISHESNLDKHILSPNHFHPLSASDIHNVEQLNTIWHLPHEDTNSFSRIEMLDSSSDTFTKSLHHEHDWLLRFGNDVESAHFNLDHLHNGNGISPNILQHHGLHDHHTTISYQSSQFDDISHHENSHFHDNGLDVYNHSGDDS